MVLKIEVLPDHNAMSIETYASRNLASEILKAYNYRCGTLPVLGTEDDELAEFLVRIEADDPAFTWGTKPNGEKFPVGFLFSRMRDGSFVLLANEDETALDLAKRVKKLAGEYLEREAGSAVLTA